MSAALFAADFVEGKDYVKVEGFPEAKTPVVREFFSYNCPHCYRMEHTLSPVVKQLGSDVSFERTPVGAGRPAWQLSQLAYYLAQTFKVTEQSHGAIFKQVQELAPFATEADVKRFFEGQGIAAADIDKALASADRSFTLMGYDNQTALSGISGVPSLLVNGKYMLNIQGRSSEELAALVKFVAKL
ncbi:thiol:disulfide interchange protein DsbA/DsbL [Shewanella sp. JM162201]|uniref:Thiol:disulfide interchange protein n=2 Tax=Shewanella jiangmenensis TaxID=2837387 RepID=A0ABS5V7S3_9GAMM|nr:thiol:disulfide interchange protein DsbA/DsbL [Shewanella jiangmenensis]